MRFWDSSAIVPQIVEEQASAVTRRWISEDAAIVVWALTRVELVSAVERRAREGKLPRPRRLAALRRIERVCLDAHEVSDIAAVRMRALPLLASHPLRAADALQLAAALLFSESNPASLGFATLDARLADAAEREGLEVFTWSDDDAGMGP
jgi:predicted nucleic acid-binding protein